MNITIKDKVGLDEDLVFQLSLSLLTNRKPKEGSFDYGLETHGAICLTMLDLEYPIQVWQVNKRTSNKSPIHIVIEKHVRII